MINNDNNDILLRTHGPYHRHKSIKSFLLYISAHYRNGVSIWPTLGGAKQFILSTAVSSFTKAQKMDNHTVGHYTTGVSTCPALRRARPIPALLTFLCLVCTQCPHIYHTKAILVRRKLRNNSQTTTAFFLHTGVLNNWGKMKICKKHQTFEAIE